MTYERNHGGGGVETAIQLLQAVGDNQRTAEAVLSYIDGIKAGIRMASASNNEKKSKKGVIRDDKNKED